MLLNVFPNSQIEDGTWCLLLPSSKLAKTSDVLHSKRSNIQRDLKSPYLNSAAKARPPSSCLSGPSHTIAPSYSFMLILHFHLSKPNWNHFDNIRWQSLNLYSQMHQLNNCSWHSHPLFRFLQVFFSCWSIARQCLNTSPAQQGLGGGEI